MFANFQPTTAFAATLLSITLSLSSTASANHHDHIDRVALRIQKRSQQLLEETSHYRQVPGYRQLVNHSRMLRDTAVHIHDVTHFEGNIAHLKRDVAVIDQSFHQLEDLFCHIEAEVERGRCHLDVNTNRFRRRLKQLEREIHHLADDLAKICAVPHTVQQTSYRQPLPAPSPVRNYGNNNNLYQGGIHSGFHGGGHNAYRSSRHQGFHGVNQPNVYRNANARTARGFSIGGGSTRIWIGF